jgi:hypothetical protein
MEHAPVRMERAHAGHAPRLTSRFTSSNYPTLTVEPIAAALQVLSHQVELEFLSLIGDFG